MIKINNARQLVRVGLQSPLLLYLLGVILIIIYQTPYIILGKYSLFNIGDILDGTIVWYKSIGESPYYFSSDSSQVIEPFLNGAVPRDLLIPGPLNMTSLLFYFFPTITALLINQNLTLIIGFSGMYLFLTKIVFHNKNQHIFGLLISLAFAFLPNKSIFGGAVFVIMPLVLYAFINVLNNKIKILEIAILFLSPFVSNLVLSSIFIFCVLIVMVIIRVIQTKRLELTNLIGLSIYFLGMVFADIYFLSFYILDNTFVSHRSEFVSPTLSDIEFIKMVFTSFITEKWSHAAALQLGIIFWLLLLVLITLMKKLKLSKTLIRILFIIFGTSFISNIFYLERLDFLKELIPIFGEFGFYRFSYLNISWWWILFSILIRDFANMEFISLSRSKHFIISILICLSTLVYVVKNNWIYRANLTHLLYNKPENYTSNTLPLYHFYSEELFTEISNYIGKDQKDYRVGSIGLHPAVPCYNGFYTIDGYSNLYNLDHKNKIESIISQELSKNNLLNNKFRYAGFRCYLFTSELYDIWNHKDKIISKNRNLSISQPEFNYTILKSLPCHYLMSTVKIELSENTPLNFLQSFEKDKLPYRIYLYELI